MSDNQQPAFTTVPPEPLHPHGRRRHRPALFAVGAVALVLAVTGVTRADNWQAVSLISDRGSSYLTSNSATVADSVTGALVDIVCTDAYQGATSAGTGMVLTSDGEILTNNHVVDGATSIKVTVVATGRSYSASVVGTAPTQDVAVIQLADASGLKTLPIGDSRAVTVGQQVAASGNAGGVGGEPSHVTGTITGLNKSITASDGHSSDSEQLTGLIETDAPIVAGDSGGALSTTSGKVVGMNTAASVTNGTAAADSDAYAIPIRTALSVAHEIESGQASSTVHVGGHGFLGVALGQENGSGDGSGGNGSGLGADGGGYGSGDGYGSTSGVVVGGVVGSGAAEAAGLQAGDVITAVDGRTVDSAATLNTIMAGTKPGQKVTLGWTDSSGQSHSATVTLGAAAAD
jgi:S1-C subfamily serine protease